MKCEQIRIAAMALLDGEEAPAPRAEVEAHLAGCVECRREVEGIKALNRALESHRRAESAEDLWPALENRLGSRGNLPLYLLAALLLVYKLIEFAPDRDLGTAIQIVPALMALAVFRFLGENPFKINAGLRLEGEESCIR